MSSDPLPNLITNGQQNTPAPWVPFTRAGCDVGAFSLADTELENTGQERHHLGVRQPVLAVDVHQCDRRRRAFDGAEGRGLRGHRDPLLTGRFSVNGAEQHGGICSPQNGGVADKPSRRSRLSTKHRLQRACSERSTPTRSPPRTRPRSRRRRRMPPGASNGNIDDLAAGRSTTCSTTASGVACTSRRRRQGLPRASAEITGAIAFGGRLVFRVRASTRRRRRRSATSRRCRSRGSRLRTRTSRTRTTTGTRRSRRSDRVSPTYETQLQEENQAFNAFFERLATTTASTRATRCSCSLPMRAITSPACRRRTRGCDGVATRPCARTRTTRIDASRTRSSTTRFQKEDRRHGPRSGSTSTTTRTSTCRQQQPERRPRCPGRTMPNVRQLEQDLGTADGDQPA